MDTDQCTSISPGGKSCTTVSDARHLIKVRESTGKGLGVFAKADIPRGTRVISEPARLEVPEQNPPAKDIIQAFERLLPSQQKSYLGLHAYAGD